VEPKHPEVVVELTDTDGNAFAIISKVRRALCRGGVPTPEVHTFVEQVMSGNYDNVLITCMQWVTVE